MQVSVNSSFFDKVIVNIPMTECFFSPSKTALLEGLEVDQYMWGILNAIQKCVSYLLTCVCPNSWSSEFRDVTSHFLIPQFRV